MSVEGREQMYSQYKYSKCGLKKLKSLVERKSQASFLLLLNYYIQWKKEHETNTVFNEEERKITLISMPFVLHC